MGRCFQMKRIYVQTLSAAAVMLSLACCPAIAQSQVAAKSVDCTASAERGRGLTLVETGQSLADLSITIATDQAKRFLPARVTLLEGPCADGVHAFRMSQLVFQDGAFYIAGLDGRLVHATDTAGLTQYWSGLFFTDHPEISQARFSMAANVGFSSKLDDAPLLRVGVWQAGETWLVAAFIRQQQGYSAPVELLRSRQPIRSVSYFPSPDTNTGRLGLVVDSGKAIALVSLDWDHDAMTRAMRAAK